MVFPRSILGHTGQMPNFREWFSQGFDSPARNKFNQNLFIMYEVIYVVDGCRMQQTTDSPSSVLYNLMMAAKCLLVEVSNVSFRKL